MSVSTIQRGSLSFFVSARKPGRFIAEVKHHTYFQLPVTYSTDRIIQAVLRFFEMTEVSGITGNSIDIKFSSLEWVFVGFINPK